MSALMLLIVMPIMTNIASEMLMASFNKKTESQDSVAEFSIEIENSEVVVRFTAEDCPPLESDGTPLSLAPQDKNILGYYLKHPRAGIIVEIDFLSSFQTTQFSAEFENKIDSALTETSIYLDLRDIQQATDNIDLLSKSQNELSFFEFERPREQMSSSSSERFFTDVDRGLLETLPSSELVVNPDSFVFEVPSHLLLLSVPLATDREMLDVCPGVTILENGSHTWCGPGSEMY